MARPSDPLAGRYDLLDVLGRGGMGTVYRAHDRMLERTVAVKVLPAEMGQDPTLVERFEREARAAARLNHPNIVAVYDSGREADVHYIVMECVPGTSLAERLREQGPLPVSESVETAAQIANGLAAAHAAGIVHRDIKPHNVMVTPSGDIKVLDFGIARATAQAALTRTTTVLGSAPYMAPEMALGQSADARSDIYSLGCVLYEMLTGRPPFLGEVPAAVMSQHASAAAQPPHELRPDVPEGLDLLVMQMLAKAPEDRPQGAEPLVGQLRSTLPEPTPAPTVAAAPLVTEATEPLARHAPPPAGSPVATTRLPPAMPPPERSGHLGTIALGAAILALLAGLAVALAASNSRQPTTSTPRSTPRTETSAPSAPTGVETPTGTTPTGTTSPPTSPTTTTTPTTRPTPSTPTSPTATQTTTAPGTTSHP